MSRGRLLAVVLAVLGAVGAVSGQEPSPPQELLQVRQQIRELETRLAGLEQRQTDLAAQRQTLEGELRTAAQHLSEWEVELRRAQQAVNEAGRSAEDARKQLDGAVARLRLQVSLLAVLGRAGLSPLVLHALGSDRDLQERVTVALALVDEERLRREEVARLADARTRSLSLLSQRKGELEALRAQGSERRAELEGIRQRVLAESARLEQTRRAGAVALADAQESETRLERLWGVVTQRDERASGSVRLLRGGLPWPVAGARVVQRFGSRRDQQYGTVTVSHGLVLAAPPGSEARAVASGRVAFAQFFKGYGNLVIVQHGADLYSLYARLSSMLVRAGDRVGMSDPVGVLGRAEEGDGNLYLEMRVGKQAQDPMGWLKPAGK
ncbi:MAG: peptidoglycan DD-metalloendopeptidase family protein [Thermoanaerobaculaceae bacterium]|jgi:septal ring factor EnvC (AmiA/AmiB activator)|nr:peptidoglycan DD-metalloendopeptidase family protein [Thermoanaerobaculaceae bacterium]